MKEGDNSPWGRIQNISLIGHDIFIVSTAGHGGIFVPNRYNKLIPHYMRNRSGWYEEDCEYAIPLFVLGAAFFLDRGIVRHILDGGAENTVIAWFPYKWEKYTGAVLPPGKSRTKDREEFLKLHAHDLIVISALSMDKERVKVIASEGGHRGFNVKGKMFVVPAAEYDARGEFFVIDPSKHEEFTGEFNG